MTIALQLTVNGRLDLELSSATVVQPTGDRFPGPYDVTPTVEGFDVGTAGKLMVYDMTVNPIPVLDVGNPSGGRTYTIA